MKILLVEDNTEDRLVMKYNIEAHGCEVIEADDGEDGLKKALSYKPDVIISDALMPKMDGFQFLRKIKQVEVLKDIPFIFYSAVYTGYKEAELAVSLGAEAFIIKPKEPEEFWQELLGLLEECKYKKTDALKAELITEEEEFLRRYSNIVVSKLEEKVKELEKAKDCAEKSEAEFRKLSKEFHGVLDAIPDNLTLQDKDLKILWANKGAAKGVGKKPEDMVGEHCYFLWHNRTAPCEPCPVVKSFETGEAAEMHVTTPDNRIWDLRTIPLKDEKGIVLNIIEVGRDITEHRKLEEQFRQAQKLEAVGQLTGGVAHDFNNILSAIIGYAHLAAMNMSSDDPVRHNIDQILEASQRAAILTQSLLAFSRKQPMLLEIQDLNDIVSGFEKFIYRLIREDIELKIKFHDKDLSVMADKTQIEQILMNLATNARDAMPQGGVLTIETRRAQLDEGFIRVHDYEGKAGEYALLSVTDTGSGMDEKTRERIFEPFFTTKGEGKGTGLGLATVYGIVKKHEGFINVYSESDRGTTFKIYLPVQRTGVKVEDIGEEEVPVTGGTETILVAEDDIALRKLSRTVLSLYGYSIIEAVDGDDAIQKYIENKDSIDLVLLDGIMPKKNGKEAYENIRTIRPDIKVIFISGYAEDIFTKQGIIEKEADFLLKPVSPNDLLRKVREALDKH